MTTMDASPSSLVDSPPRHALPQNRYPTSRWQQLKQSIAAKQVSPGVGGVEYGIEYPNRGSDTRHPWQLAVQSSLVDQDASSLHTAALDAASPGTDEVADVLRRGADISILSPTSNDSGSQLTIQPDGRIVSSTSNWYQEHLDTSAAGDLQQSLTLTGTAWRPNEVSSVVNGSSQQHPHATVGRSPSKQAPLQQLKQQRQQSRPRQQPTAANRTGARAVTSASINARSSQQLNQRQPTRAQSATASNASSSQVISRATNSSRDSTGSTFTSTSMHPAHVKQRPATTGALSSKQLKPAGAARLLAGPASLEGAASGHSRVHTAGSGSNNLDSIEGVDSSLEFELQHELSQQQLQKTVRRWQQATADVQLEKARARPMHKLLSKRKALRAWKQATQQQLGRQASSSSEQELPATSQLQLRQSQQAEPQLQSATSESAIEEHLQQQQSQHQLNDRLARREQIAAQFHKMYQLHNCLQCWRQQAAARALQRSRDEQDRVMAEEQARALKQEQQREQQQLQQQKQQQQQHSLAVAANFHRLYVLHHVMTSWRQQASVLAALNKLFPATSLAAAAKGDTAARHSLCFPVGMASNELQAAAVVQHKAQQLLKRLAAKQTAQQLPQQQHQQLGPSQQQQQLPAVVQQSGQARAEQGRHAPEQQLQPRPQQQDQPPSGLLQQASGNLQASQLDTAGTDTTQAPQTLEANTTSPCTQTDVLELNQALGDFTRESSGAVMQLAAGTVQQHPPDSTEVAAVNVGLEQQQHAATAGLGPSQTAAQEAATDTAVGDAAQEAVAPEVHWQQVKPSIIEPAGEPSAEESTSSSQQQQQQRQEDSMSQPSASSLLLQIDPQHLVQQQQQWAAECQQLQQQLRRLLAAEQRQQREEQKLVQQLQAELATEQTALAELHYNLGLARRVGLVSWRQLMQLRKQQEVTASTWRSVGLQKAAMMVWKLMLVHRRKRHVCCHIKAYGCLQQLHQQQEKATALHALATWAQASKQYRHWLLQRVLQAWRAEQQTAQQLQAAAKQSRDERTKRSVLRAWLLYVEQQAQEQLLLDLELDAAAKSWRHRWWQQRVLTAWHVAARTAVQERHQEARRQETWGKVRRWLSELDTSKRDSSQAADAVAVAIIGDKTDKASHCRASIAPAAAVHQPAAVANGGRYSSQQWDAEVDDDSIIESIPEIIHEDLSDFDL